MSTMATVYFHPATQTFFQFVCYRGLPVILWAAAGTLANINHHEGHVSSQFAGLIEKEEI